ncbi:uncharacterized protein N0V89_003456 [Didymosphaeria variabile]|uniref:NACHT domain-containing protein n=1 Tax=Didymosphaeria variabile TaxID=1932322 RepID=A0A9W8XMP0_9PLEO|nr:uncharacterized protein N0V89_003456 [Didymosphaeria variabile]KAJ4355440.1 hypothetical protein N0V89_003456 [Didymosphaeria variabile]
MSTQNTDDIFEKAHNAFINSLSEKEKARFAKCSSPEELLETLRNFKIMSTKRQKKTLNRCLGVVKSFNDKLRPYFDAINVIASANDTVAIAYGAFRLVLELASGFPTLFERLILVLERLSNTFPQYSAIIELFEGNPPARMRRHLESVYQDLFRFIQMATRIFTASSGKVKRPLSMITNVIWKPFDAQFSSLLEAMDDHRKFIIDELEIHQAQQAKDSERAAAIERKRAEEERQRAEVYRKQADDLSRQSEARIQALNAELRESTLQRILDWLAPPLFVEALENSQEQREEGTAEWIFENQIYKDWLRSKVELREGVTSKRMPPWVLWVHGNPGSGKTILAASVVEEVSEASESELQSHQICYFFFKHDDRKNSTLDAAYRSILAQILRRARQADGILDKFLFARVSSSPLSGQQRATSKELHELVRVLASDFDHLTIILDGIDEAIQPDMLGRQLKELVTASPIKLILFSRPNVNSLHKLVDQRHRIAVNREAMSSDIRLFLEHQLQEFVDNEKLPDSADIEGLAETLLYGADGMFLWAKLMINYLSSFALSPQSRLATINSVHYPEGLNTMYDRILSLITTAGTPQSHLAQRILLWMNHATDGSYLTCKFLHEATSDHSQQRVPDDFISTVISVCGGLVECNHQKYFQFTHLTVKDYLKERALLHSSGSTAFIPDAVSAAEFMTARCIHHIRCRAPTKSPAVESGFSSYPTDFVKEQSFCKYAIRYWSYHLSKTVHSGLDCVEHPDRESTISMSKSICGFLSSPCAVAFWIEGIYGFLADMDGWFKEIEIWIASKHSHHVRKTANRLRELSNDLKAIDKEWGGKLHEVPARIWTDVPVFADVGIAAELGKALGTELVKKMEPLAQTHDNGDAIRCLSTISSLTSDGAIMATLNIYPSSSFEWFWKSIDPNTAYNEAERHCPGWTAKYEIWSTESKLRIASASLALPESEIRLLIRQSFRQDPYRISGAISYSEQDDRSFDTSFALAIGPDCLTFSVLRTVYAIAPGDSPATSTSRSFILPLKSLTHFENRWGSHLKPFRPDYFAILPPNEQVGWRDWYAYSISFSGTGQYIAFADYQMPCITHVAIFEIFRKPAFYISAPVCLPTANTRPSRVFESLSFSACGMYLLARDKNDVEVLPIPKDMLALKTIAQPTDLEIGQLVTTNVPSTSVASVLDLQQSWIHPGRLLPDTHLVNTEDGSNCSKALLVTTTDNELKIESVQPGMSKDSEYLQISSLPQSFSTENSTVNLQVPTSSTESLRVIFNKRAAESYSLSDGRHGQFPCIMDRKLKSIARIEKAPPPQHELLRIPAQIEEAETSHQTPPSPHKWRKMNDGDISTSKKQPR